MILFFAIGCSGCQWQNTVFPIKENDPAPEIITPISDIPTDPLPATDTQEAVIQLPSITIEK